MSTKSHLLKIVSSLSDKIYRSLFVETQIETLIPFQIRAMRTRLGWTQKQLAKEAGMAQGRISLLESPNYEGAVNVKTLLKIAAAFDVGLVVRFAPFSEVAQWSSKLSHETHAVPTYEGELSELIEATESETYPIKQRSASVTVRQSNSFSLTSFRNAAA